MHDRLLDLVPGATARESPAAERRQLPRLAPDALGPGQTRDRDGGGVDLLAVCELQRRDPEHLVAKPRRRPLEICELLGGQQHADAGLPAAGQQRQHVVGAERRELIERDRRRHRCAATGSFQPAAGRAGQVLDRERPELRRELAVRG